ncbi:hypothetical protein psal_cds_1121 [Pandoravirus salinus]|uniref:Uncharacterized protein n=1 Tax=Pandoravirus salinus TaxID=1349410 RepID=S4VXG1_9VIRU|nr:hypothetical protein psal_cds_1121 [Pandoravirus salinus]AGO85359.1 hypothetical protein psal_cds_1121 [Pandoravirus salinus]
MAANTVVVFFNAAQETAPLPASGRYVLPDDAVAASAVVYADGRDGPTPVPFSVEGGGAPARVAVAKDGANFAGDLISLDPHSVTLATGPGVTQTVEGYESVSVQQRDRPVVAVDPDASFLRDSAQVAFMREGLSWRPSYLVYLGDTIRGDHVDRYDGNVDNLGENTYIRQIVGVADIDNRRDEAVAAHDAWLAAARVPLPPPQTPRPRPRAARMAAATTQDMSEEAPHMLMASRAPVPSAAAYASDVDYGDAEQDADDRDNKDGAANYHVGPLRLDRGASLTLPLFVTGAPAEQAEVRFGTLPTGPSAPGDRATGVARGYRFVAQEVMPAGRATVFDPDMRFAGIADVSSAVPGEPVDLVLGPSVDVNVDAWVQVTTTYEPLASVYNDIGDDPAESNRSDGTLYNNDADGTGVNGPIGRDHARPVVARIVDRVAIRGTMHNGADHSVLLVLAYRPVFGGVVCASEPPYNRMARGVIEWQAVVPPGSTDLEIDLDVDRGQRLLPGSLP